MLRSVSLAIASLALIGAAMPAYCQSAPNDKVAITVTRAELQIIGQGLMELPYKTAAQVMNDLQVQLNAADQAVAKAAADAPKAAAAEGNPDKGAGPSVPASKPEEKTADAPAK